MFIGSNTGINSIWMDTAKIFIKTFKVVTLKSDNIKKIMSICWKVILVAVTPKPQCLKKGYLQRG